MPKSDQGVTRDRYMLIPRVLIFLTRGEKVLLIKGAAHKRLWANKYNGVGGHIERGEDVISAARRELFEETGLTADLLLCGTVIVDASDELGIGMYILTGESVEGEPQPSSEGKLEWVGIRDLESLPLVEDVAIFLKRIDQMQPGEQPFSARSFYDDSGVLTVEFWK